MSLTGPHVLQCMVDYWQHWLDMEGLLKNPPKISTVNWLRADDEGNFIWPGFGDNPRVLESVSYPEARPTIRSLFEGKSRIVRNYLLTFP